MYSGLRHLVPSAVASTTSTRKSPGLSLLKSAKRCVVSLYRAGEALGRTFRQVTGAFSLSKMRRSAHLVGHYRLTFTFAPPDCKRRRKPASLAWSMFSITVQPLNAPCGKEGSVGSTASYLNCQADSGISIILFYFYIYFILYFIDVQSKFMQTLVDITVALHVIFVNVMPIRV